LFVTTAISCAADRLLRNLLPTLRPAYRGFDRGTTRRSPINQGPLPEAVVNRSSIAAAVLFASSPASAGCDLDKLHTLMYKPQLSRICNDKYYSLMTFNVDGKKIEKNWVFTDDNLRIDFNWEGRVIYWTIPESEIK
jgi:hypothetical protein